jgi:hypothetical protein
LSVKTKLRFENGFHCFKALVRVGRRRCRFLTLNTNQYSVAQTGEEFKLLFNGQKIKAGIFVLSIDVALPVEHTSAAATTLLEKACERLLALLNTWKLPATWAIDEPAHWALGKRLQAASASQEIAILAGAEWVGSAAGRNVFAQELGRRVLASRAAGLEVTTIVPHESTIDDHLDLLVQHEVTAVRGNVDGDARATRPAQPHPLHYGLWEMPGSLALPQRNHWLPGGGGFWKARRGIRRAVAAREIFHVVLDVATLVESGPQAERNIQRVLRMVAQQQDSSSLLAMTLAQAAQHLTPVRNRASSRSILRAAS